MSPLSSKAIVGPVSLTSTATELHAVTVDGAVPISVSWSATPTFNFNLGNLFKITLTGDTTPMFSNVGSNPRRTMFLIAQDSTGGRAFTWPAGWTNMPPVTRTANAVTAIEALFDGTNAYPVAPGSNLKLQVDDKTINAGFFAGASNALRVNAAIAYAVANSFTAVRVPASMLPYDASAVTFNSAVHMIREGGSSTLDEYDVEAYGAYPATDSYYAIAACLSAVGQSGNPSVVRLPRATSISTGYRHSKPLIIGTPGTKLFGPATGINGGVGASLVPTYRYGFGLAIQDSSTTVPGLTTALVSGTGQSWANGTTARFFNLRDLATMDLNGLTQFSIRGFIQPTTADLNSSTALFSSQDDFVPAQGTGATNGASIACLLHFNGVGTGIRLKFTTSTTGYVDHNMAAADLVAGVTYYWEMSWDGSTARVFWGRPGGTVALLGSFAHTGTLVQGPAEDCLVGASGATAPETNIVGSVNNGPIYSLQVSNVAKHTSDTTFTAPSAAFASDANTLALMLFDEQVNAFTKVYTKDGDAYCFLRRVEGPPNGVYGWEISGVNFYGSSNRTSGVMIGSNCANGKMNRVYMYLVRSGIWGGLRDAYMMRFSDVFINATGGWYGVALNGNNAEQMHWDTLIIFGGRILFASGQGGHTFTNCFFQTAAGTEVGIALSSNAVTGTVFNASTIVTEVTPASSYFASLVLFGQPIGAHPTTLEWNGGAIAGARSRPMIHVHRTAVVGFNGATFGWNGTPASSIMSVSATAPIVPPLQPVQFNRCWQSGTWKPWSDTAGYAKVGPLGKLAAITFSTPITLDCSLRDDFELAAITGAITINFSNVTPGQKISLWTVQNAGGGNSITFGTVNGTGAVKGATANDTTASHWTQYVFDMNLAGNLTQVGFNSGA